MYQKQYTECDSHYHTTLPKTLSHYTIACSLPSMKLLIVGETGVGKKSIMNAMGCRTYLDHHHRDPSMYDNNSAREIDAISSECVIMGNSYSVLSVTCVGSNGDCKNTFARRANGVMVVFDLSASQPFKRLSSLLSTIRSECGDVPICLCGTKSDVASKSTLCKESSIRSKMIGVDDALTSLVFMSSRTRCRLYEPIRWFKSVCGHNKWSNYSRGTTSGRL